MNILFLVLVGAACLMSAILGSAILSFVVSPSAKHHDDVMAALLLLILALVLVGETFCLVYWR